ncbi:hypothetical protein GALL_410420 [mine drainage metagenome]|uniref:Uncharacterized protein n=1 Tax=mine drainage metagenome TaxID=410659 RepID=A0A1J5Q0R2_9ZZZZ
MRPAAEVGEVAFGVERNLFDRRNALDQLGLVVLADALEISHRLVARQHLAGNRNIAPGEFGHAPLDRLQVFRGERPLVGKIIIEAVVDHRADSHLRIREQLLDRISQEVSGGVANDVEALGVALGNDGEVGVSADEMGGIDQRPVHATGQGGPRKTSANARGDFQNRDRRVECALGAIRQADNRHSASRKLDP